jgi:two-component system sensor histidine kinase KdpD
VKRRWIELIAWVALTVVITVLLVQARAAIDNAHVALAYLLVVLLASSRMGRGVGLALAIAAFFSFNFFFIRPYYTLAIHHPLDWLVLLAFLAASTVATQLLHRARAEADRAERRAAEIDRLAAVGAETLKAGRAIDAVNAVAHVIRSGLDVSACEIYRADAESGRPTRIARAERNEHSADASPPGEHVIERAIAGLAIGETLDGTSYVAGTMETLSAGELALSAETRALLMPLRVHDVAIGALRIEEPAGLRLDLPQQRFAEALSYYAVLALERIRFAADAERAESLREADRLKDALLASVSHDLRTPLTTIKALAHEMASGGDDRAVVIEEEADRLNRFVSDLLDLSRLNAGAEHMEPELIAAEDVLGAALQRVSGTTKGRTINASLDPRETLLVGRFDFVHTLRALVNLIENATKYSPDYTPVDVSVRRDDNAIAFDVADRGPGVAPSERDRIFDPFVRGSDTGKNSGVGLGLAIARQSVELQGGSLVYSPREGGGSVFTVRVPIAAAADLTDMSL